MGSVPYKWDPSEDTARRRPSITGSWESSARASSVLALFPPWLRHTPVLCLVVAASPAENTPGPQLAPGQTPLGWDQPRHTTYAG